MPPSNLPSNVQKMNDYDRASPITVEWQGGLSDPANLQLAVHCLAFEVCRLWTREGIIAYNNERLPINSATNAAPIVINTLYAHGLSNNETVIVEGVIGLTAANGTWQVTVIDANNFSLKNSVGNLLYISGGTWKRPGAMYEDIAPQILAEAMNRVSINPATAAQVMLLTDGDKATGQNLGENYYEHGVEQITGAIDASARKTLRRDSGVS